MGRLRIGRGDDPGREGQRGPGRGVDVGEDRGGARAEPVSGHRNTGRRERIPPAAVMPDLHEPRHQHATDERRDPGRLLLDGRLRGVEHEPGIRFVVEPLGERRLPVPCRLGRPSLAPGRRRGLRDLAMRTGQPGQGPGPRHDPVRVVAAAARREPPATGVQMRDRVHEPGRRPVGRRGHVEVGERIPGVRIGAVLRHDQVGRERGGQFGEQEGHGVQPRTLSGPGRHRDVDARAGRDPLPHLVDVAGPREQGSARLVEGDRQHARIVPVDRLHAVAVMHIEIDVQHPQPIAPGTGDRERRVVVDAEPGRPIRHRVMQPTTRVLGVLDLPAQDRLDGPQRPAGHGRRSLVHVREGRAITALADPRLRKPVGVDREALDHLQIRLGVAPQELLVRGGLGRQSRFRPDGTEQVDPGPEPPRR